MPRIRSIKPEFFTSPTIAKLSFRAALTFVGLWVYVDDEGRGRDDPRLIKAAVWPQRDDVTVEDIVEDLRELNMLGLIVRYDNATSGDRGLKRGTGRAPVDSPLNEPVKYLCVRSWQEHQRINRRTKSKLPRPPAKTRKLSEPSLFTHEDRTQEVEVGSGTGNREVEQGGGVRGGGKAKTERRSQATKAEPRTPNLTTPAREILDDLARRKIASSS